MYNGSKTYIHFASYCKKCARVWWNFNNQYSMNNDIGVPGSRYILGLIIYNSFFFFFFFENLTEVIKYWCITVVRPIDIAPYGKKWCGILNFRIIKGQQKLHWSMPLKCWFRSIEPLLTKISHFSRLYLLNFAVLVNAALWVCSKFQHTKSVPTL